ncbi:MAG: GIY-YIG nuclease family protein [bacterium]
MYFVYILECEDGSLYTGITTDVERRFKEHKNRDGGHYTSSRKVIRIAFTEEHPDRSSATKREMEIKSWPRERKQELIRSSQGLRKPQQKKHSR